MRKWMLFSALVLALCLLLASPILSQEVPLYLDTTQSADARADDLLARMSLAQRIGQMTLIEKNSITPDEAAALFLGGILSGGGGNPSPNTPEAWAVMTAEYQLAALETPLGIPQLYGVDAVHGHNNVYGATIFPHNIGLGAADRPDLVEAIAQMTARDMLATGVNWNYAPVLAVPQDIRWGRTYEAYGADIDLVTSLGLAFMRGLQPDITQPGSVLATPKHFIGDGGTTWGTSSFGPDFIDRGDTIMDEATLRELFLSPYQAAVDAGALSIMASFSSWNGTPMHAHAYLLTDVLKGELGFSGFIVSDWAAIDLIDEDYDLAVASAINAGVDMAMVPYDADMFIDSLTRAVESGAVPQARIDDAVRRILRVKFMMGLFERPFGDDALLPLVGDDASRALAREAVAASLVLLQNDGSALPLTDDIGTIFVAGSGADDIGLQAGGWTIEWQGGEGPITTGTTILDGIQAAAPDAEIVFRGRGNFDNLLDESGAPQVADVGIVVVSEPPYAEHLGDRETLTLSGCDQNAIINTRAQSDRLIVVVLSGRPLVMPEVFEQAEAVVAAWLPGSEGAAVADVLFGGVPFTGRLPFAWPSALGVELYPVGYGLSG
jgi:beta-glucosidase